MFDRLLARLNATPLPTRDTVGAPFARRDIAVVVLLVELAQSDRSLGAAELAAVGRIVRVERPGSAALVPSLAASFAGRFRSLTLGAPSLEDVFVDRTGHTFDDAPAAGEGAA